MAPYTESEVNLAVWYIVTDGSGVNTSRVDELIRRHNDTEKIADQYLSGTYIQASPVEELRPYQRIVTVLTLTLTVFSIPIVVLLIIFLVMLVGLVVDGQRNETAVLAQPRHVALPSGGLDHGRRHHHGLDRARHWRLACPFVYPVDRRLPQLYGLPLGASLYRFRAADHRLDHCPGDRLHHSHPRHTDIGAARHTIISYKMDQSRLLQRPWWQRLGVDVLLLVLIGYFYYQIIQQGGLIDVEGGVRNIEDAYDQPLVFLLPP